MSDNNHDDLEIAVFPIPACVCFPFGVMPLHVFEPRYRSLIKDSVRLGRRIGISHTVKAISSVKKNQTKAEILNSNQDTYEAEKIFSAGFAEIETVTADGRMGVIIRMDGRYESVNEIQTLPYRIDRCRIFQDEKTTSTQSNELKLRVLKILQSQLESSPAKIRALFESAKWDALPAEEFSFRIFSELRLETKISQAILEMRSVDARLNSLLRILEENNRLSDF